MQRGGEPLPATPCPPHVSLPQFLDALFESGQVTVGPLAAALDREEAQAACRLLEQCERDVRADHPGDPPSFHAAAALWGAERFYRAAQLTVFRDAGADVVEAAFADAPPQTPAAEQHYAMDLTWRYLPDLLRLARTASQADPLVGALERFAAQWPLSSVGLPGVTPVSLEGVVDHPSLWQAYLDRIVARKDASRLEDPRVKQALREGLGLHAQLAAPLDKILQE